MQVDGFCRLTIKRESATFRRCNVTVKEHSGQINGKETANSRTMGCAPAETALVQQWPTGERNGVLAKQVFEAESGMDEDNIVRNEDQGFDGLSETLKRGRRLIDT